MVTRHEFLARLHHLLSPRVYLEIGVDTGASLRLASCLAIGIDPNPRIDPKLPATAEVFVMTSDEFFKRNLLSWKVDLAFIDGMHRWEYAARDFINVERASMRRGVVVFDDVLPYNQHMTGRDMVPGDWTGDVWRVYEFLSEHRPDLDLFLVDTFPTGTLMVLGLDPLYPWPREVLALCADEDESDVPELPDAIRFRTTAVSAEYAIDVLKEEFSL